MLFPKIVMSHNIFDIGKWVVGNNVTNISPQQLGLDALAKVKLYYWTRKIYLEKIHFSKNK